MTHAGTVACLSCGTAYDAVDGILLLVPALSAQHEHRRSYFDAAFARLGGYRVDAWRQSFDRRIFEALRLVEAGGPNLDAGEGGSGASVIEAARLGVVSAGCDLSVEGVASAARFAGSEGVSARTTFVVCAAESLPSADRSFAAASAVAVLEHLDDDAAAVAELARVLEPRGRVWVTVPHAYRLMPPLVWPACWLHAPDRAQAPLRQRTAPPPLRGQRARARRDPVPGPHGEARPARRDARRRARARRCLSTLVGVRARRPARGGAPVLRTPAERRLRTAAQAVSVPPTRAPASLASGGTPR